MINHPPHTLNKTRPELPNTSLRRVPKVAGMKEKNSALPSYLSGNTASLIKNFTGCINNSKADTTSPLRSARNFDIIGNCDLKKTAVFDKPESAEGTVTSLQSVGTNKASANKVLAASILSEAECSSPCATDVNCKTSTAIYKDSQEDDLKTSGGSKGLPSNDSTWKESLPRTAKELLRNVSSSYSLDGLEGTLQTDNERDFQEENVKEETTEVLTVTKSSDRVREEDIPVEPSVPKSKVLGSVTADKVERRLLTNDKSPKMKTREKYTTQNLEGDSSLTTEKYLHDESEDTGVQSLFCKYDKTSNISTTENNSQEFFIKSEEKKLGKCNEKTKRETKTSDQKTKNSKQSHKAGENNCDVIDSAKECVHKQASTKLSSLKRSTKEHRRKSVKKDSACNNSLTPEKEKGQKLTTLSQKLPEKVFLLEDEKKKLSISSSSRVTNEKNPTPDGKLSSIEEGKKRRSKDDYLALDAVGDVSKDDRSGVSVSEKIAGNAKNPTESTSQETTNLSRLANDKVPVVTSENHPYFTNLCNLPKEVNTTASSRKNSRKQALKNVTAEETDHSSEINAAQRASLRYNSEKCGSKSDECARLLPEEYTKSELEFINRTVIGNKAPLSLDAPQKPQGMAADKKIDWAEKRSCKAGNKSNENTAGVFTRESRGLTFDKESEKPLNSNSKNSIRTKDEERRVNSGNSRRSSRKTLREEETVNNRQDEKYEKNQRLEDKNSGKIMRENAGKYEEITATEPVKEGIKIFKNEDEKSLKDLEKEKLVAGNEKTREKSQLKEGLCAHEAKEKTAPNCLSPCKSNGDEETLTTKENKAGLADKTINNTGPAVCSNIQATEAQEEFHAKRNLKRPRQALLQQPEEVKTTNEFLAVRKILRRPARPKQLQDSEQVKKAEPETSDPPNAKKVWKKAQPQALETNHLDELKMARNVLKRPVARGKQEEARDLTTAEMQDDATQRPKRIWKKAAPTKEDRTSQKEGSEDNLLKENKMVGSVLRENCDPSQKDDNCKADLVGEGQVSSSSPSKQKNSSFESTRTELSASKSADSAYGSSPSTPQPNGAGVVTSPIDETLHAEGDAEGGETCQRSASDAKDDYRTLNVPSRSSSSVCSNEGDTTTTEDEETDTESDFSGSGEVRSPIQTPMKYKKYVLDDFVFLKVLGKGSFGKVMLSQQKGTENYFAVKCLKKDVVLEDNDVDCTLIERRVLTIGTKHPYLCHLFCSFQTPSHLFFVMEYLTGGDLMFHIQHVGRFDEYRSCFYAAEICSGLRFLHNKGIIYRDLKLDNILLDYQGHIRLADFGMCKLQIYLDRYADTFCGTPDYMAPEVIKGLHYNQCVDWWSFGVLLYEMMVGKSPFKGCDEDHLFWLICNEQPFYPRFLSKEAQSILKQLLDKDSTRRLGIPYSVYGDIRHHPFFKYIDWNKIERKEMETPYKPRLRHMLDVQYFDKLFTKRNAELTPLDEGILETMNQSPFKDFSYTNPNITD